MKLPAFYLLDAISKNVYEPYARHFASFVIPLFLETYGQVDEVTRNKMEEMLFTWRTGSPTGKELFGVAPQIAIERGVWGNGSSRVTKAQVLSELEYTLGQKERALQANPYDMLSQNHVSVLHQLRRLVEAGVSQEELQQILGQLRALVRQAPPSTSTAPSSTATWTTQASYPGPLSHAPYPPPSSTSSAARSYKTPYPNGHFIKSEVGNSQALASTSTSPPAISSDNIANLLSTLLKAGVVSASATPEGAGILSKDEEKDSLTIDLERETSRDYRKFILSQKVQLSSLDITRKRSNIAEFLYGQLTTQCKQCGVRFADTVTGKKNMENHLDMHFRQNRKATQNVGRGHSRSWFISIEDWLHDLPRDIKGKGREDGSKPYNARAIAAEEVAKRDAELRAQFVVVPPGDEAKLLSCPICKELLKSEFLEDDEDWVWKNAIRKEDKVYHATCYAEATSVKSSYAARLLFGSRAGTPESQSSRVTPPPTESRVSKSPSMSPLHESKVAGTKRKVQSDDNSFSAGSTPPFKKAALSS
ncbi:hypothetical protein AX14_004211 [Amanita brunnescens Koide BX004]|nr:hypothetical protein AX14_004211 [Amanita brunnescens Koide BX004]